MNYIDKLLNRITMYKLVLWGLIALLGVAEILSVTGVLSLSSLGILLTAAIVFSVCYVADYALSRLYAIPANAESAAITGLILGFILPQSTTLARGVGVAVCAIIAIASKYVIAWHGKHIFNPAAFGAATAGIVGLIYASWWIGSPILAPFVLIFGLLVVRKIRRFGLFFCFLITSLLVSILVASMNHTGIGGMLHDVILSSPLLFLGTIMLTEPATMPPTNYYRIVFGIMVGVLFAAQVHVGSQSLTPEIALIIGNLFAYFVSFKQKLTMKLISKTQIGAHSYDFVFEPNWPLRFTAGQYLQWTLPHKNTDWEGNRRTFSIASSPKQKQVRIGINAYEKGSSYKKALVALTPGDTLQAGALAGDFMLPSDTSQKLVWIAGGIGITPFRSMAEYLVDADQKRTVNLFYIANQADQVPYKRDLETARKVGVNTIYINRAPYNPNQSGAVGAAMGALGDLTPDRLKAAVPDYKDRHYYVSGSPDLVVKTKKMLASFGVSKTRITTDYFSGY
jgi:ferredoxin-NADP reductase/Na+-transporting NADH:ubiquinone oxidoreductase subunit NqrB